MIVTPIKETYDITFNSTMSSYLEREKMPKIEDSRYTRRDEVNTFSFDMDLRTWNQKVAEAKSFIEDPLDSKMESTIRAKGKDE